MRKMFDDQNSTNLQQIKFKWQQNGLKSVDYESE